ncbi:MAG: Asp-tRNA(Asn)/Glu-tRNA(Gln) amidotransferase subunit GatB [Candidatus Moranbacteria bacterium]|nr:Asp-tRNA(Asn)/Glu-tRNA(Gln) amidotransferase subunit GatB [Candidatus Moranbacteria bacterium]
MEKYKTTIGVEIHVELGTESKMFCSCGNGMGQEPEPNKNICPVCTGQPGSLPVPNEKAIEYVMRAGLALRCQIARQSKFDRKNYFYPDLPKGYQISQYDRPLCEKGVLEFDYFDENEKRRKTQVGITRIHLEEDTGKSMHSADLGETLVDFNRAGVPLMELVTEPDIRSAKEAKKFCEELRRLFRYIGISPADMEKGQMRCEANISVYLQGQDPLSGTKVELKNLNSFKSIEKGIRYEAKRQAELLEKGEKVKQETRGWDEGKNKSFQQRTKEEADDYRYFPEPDIQPMQFSDQEIDGILQAIPELPRERVNRFIKEYGLTEQNAEILTDYKEMADYFEQACSELYNWTKIEKQKLSQEQRKKLYKLAANYLLTETQKHLFDSGRGIEEIKITPENFAELIKIIYQGEINSSSAQIVLKEMFETGADPSHVIEEKDLAQSSDEGELKKIVEQVIENNPKSIEDYQNGKDKAIKFLMGQVMAAAKGKADPQAAMKILKEKLEK